ncbi:HK97 gp10 family phage protein [Verrucosispora sp. NA02020]|uniref:HK97 gp10 family phage protein n=1 Tax=Verrucosispora sp. NA02020 TaxID=2742132 RepID=UPI003D709165
MTRRRLEHHGARELVADLASAAANAPDEAAKVVKRGAENVKKDAQRRVTGLKRLPHYPRAIGYDVVRRGTVAEATVGPDTRKRQGSLGHLVELGSPTSAPHPHMGPAGDAEEPKFTKAMEDLAVRLVEGR